MPYYPPVSEVRKRLEEAIPKIADRYKVGVQNAEWQRPTLAQAENYYSALDKIKAEDRYRKGVSATSDEAWRKGAIEKGAPILPTRLRDALPKWEREWGPLYENVKKVASALPPRTGDFRANVMNRVIPIIEAWKRQRTA